MGKLISIIFTAILMLQLSPAQPPETCTDGLLEQDIFVYQQPTEEEIYILAQALSGECYSYDLEDQRNACMVLLNRVDDPRWPNTLESVIRNTGIYGYSPYNRPAQVYIDTATQALDDYYCRKIRPDFRSWNEDIFFWHAVNGVNEYTRTIEEWFY